MTDSANVKSIDAVRQFAAAVIQFREEAKICVTRLEMEIGKVIGWLERDRPGFWKREAEHCDRRYAESRVMLHQCRMRRVGDFRPTCFEEQKMVQHCKQQLEFARKQVGVIRHWSITARQEADEYFGRATQLVQTLERDLPQLIALLQQSIDRLDNYNKVQLPSWSPDKLDFGNPLAWGAGQPSQSDDGPVEDSDLEENEDEER
jgi:hypothetical protein